MKLFSTLYFLFFLNFGLSANKAHVRESQEFVRCVKLATDILVDDVTSPVAAARYYAYILLTAHEVQSVLAPDSYPSLLNVVNSPPQLIVEDHEKHDVHLRHATSFAVLAAAKSLLPSGAQLSGHLDSLTSLYIAQGASTVSVHASRTLAEKISQQMIRWANTDGFQQLNNLKRYTPKRAPQYWQPTGPAFMAPVEPHWKTIRPMLLERSDQYLVSQPNGYDTDQSSAFYKELKEVYDISKNLDKNRELIARFWDCNPFAVQQIGHIEYGLKQLSPGGHWIGITGIACIKRRFSLAHTVLVHALVAISLHDAFIACWDEKYRSDRVRPVTAIKKLIDPRWEPLLQTPPFPEYVSGHSVVSSCAGIVLTRIFGDKFGFVDTTELEFGLPKRRFKSFRQAGQEASISRLYGGIHYRDGIDQGIWLGEQVGHWSIHKLDAYFPKW